MVTVTVSDTELVTCEEVLVPDEVPDEVPEEDCRLTVCEVLSASLDVCCSEPQPAKAKERTRIEPAIIIAIFCFIAVILLCIYCYHTRFYKWLQSFCRIL